MNLKETGCENMGWIHLAWDRDPQKIPVNTAMNFQLP
jgi:hypothetical protein